MGHVLWSLAEAVGKVLVRHPAVGVMLCVSIGLTAEAVFKLGRIMAMTRVAGSSAGRKS